MLENNNSEIICPVCAKQDIGFWFTKDQHNIHECYRCGTAFVFPASVSTVDIYGPKYFTGASENNGFGYTDYDFDKEPMRESFSKFLFSIEGVLPEKNVFDVGAATGFFLDIARDRGFSTAGIEISDYAGQEAQKRGHDVSVGFLPDIVLDRRFNLVTAWDVLEHVGNPFDYVVKIRELLNEGGFVAVNTINRRGWWPRLLGRHWHLIVPPEHLVFYTTESLAEVFSRAGFSIIEMKRLDKKFTLSYIFKMLYKWQGFRFWLWLSSLSERPPLRFIKIPINLGDNVFILAQKTDF